MKAKRIFSLFIASLLFAGILLTPTFTSAALTFDGTAGAGGNGTSINATGGYAIENEWADEDGNPNHVLGLRFSLYNTVSKKTKGTTIDVYRSDAPYVSTYMGTGWLKPTEKYNKKQLADAWNNQSLKLTMGTSATNLLTDANLDIELPATTDGIEEAIVDDDHTLVSILTKIYGGKTTTMDDLVRGDRLLIEPFYALKIKGDKCILTTAEIAFFGCTEFGPNTKITSSANAGSWSFIADYTNRHFPNAIRLTESSGVFDNTTAIGSSSWATFGTILQKGYGLAVAYNPVTERGIRVYYAAAGGSISASKSSSFKILSSATVNGTSYSNLIGNANGTAYYEDFYIDATRSDGGAVKLTRYAEMGLVRTGYHGATSKEWKRTAILTGTTYFNERQQFTFNSFCEKLGASWADNAGGLKTYVLTANWERNKFMVYYHPDNSSEASATVTSVTYGTATKTKTHDELSFNKTGYTFKGWRVWRSDNGGQFQVLDGSGNRVWKTANEIKSGNYEYYLAEDGVSLSTTSEVNGGQVRLYAQWAPNSYTLTVDPNGGEWTYNGVTYTEPVEISVAADSNLSGFYDPFRDQHSFTGWTLSNSSCYVSVPYYHQGIGDCTIVANWDADGTTMFHSYIRFISEQYYYTLEAMSKWREEPLASLLKEALANDMSDNTTCDQVWYFSAEDYEEVHEWCQEQGKGEDTNQAFLDKYAEDHRIWKKED